MILVLPAAGASSHDQPFLLRAASPLQRVLPTQRIPDRLTRLGINQSDGPTAAGVARAAPAIVNFDARLRIAGVAGVQGSVDAADDVDEVHAGDCSTATRQECRSSVSEFGVGVRCRNSVSEFGVGLAVEPLRSKPSNSNVENHLTAFVARRTIESRTGATSFDGG